MKTLTTKRVSVRWWSYYNSHLIITGP